MSSLIPNLSTAWIGLTVADDAFQWLDGSPLDYLKPLGIPNSNFRGTIYLRKWNRSDQNSNLPSLFQRPYQDRIDQPLNYDMTINEELFKVMNAKIDANTHLQGVMIEQFSNLLIVQEKMASTLERINDKLELIDKRLESNEKEQNDVFFETK